MENRRKFFRIDAYQAYLDIGYEILGGIPRKAKSRLKDLAREGLRISSRDALPQGASLELDIRIPGDYVHITAFGETMWSRQNDGYFYDTGIRFTKIRNHDRARLLGYVYDQWVKTIGAESRAIPVPA